MPSDLSGRVLQCWIAGVVLLTVGIPNSFAEIGDVTLRTDHEHYPGEGAFQTPRDCVDWATRGCVTDHDRTLALFNWILTHQWHLMSPQEWIHPGRVPGADPNDSEMMVYDANRGRLSYGYGLCGTVHAWNEVYWRALGLDACRRAFPGHTNSEVFVAGKWRVFDTDMAGVVLQTDRTVAGYEGICNDLSLLDRDQAPLPRYPFAWPSDFEAMKAGWQKVAQGGNWYRLFHGGYAALPAVVHLRTGETVTRYFGPDAFGGPEKRRFWHQQPGGPQRLWTFANGGAPFHDGAHANCRGDVSFGNAVYEFAPDLTSPSCKEGMRAIGTAQVTATGLHNQAEEPTDVIFEHFSPYVICGDPVDDKDPMTGQATDGFIVEGVMDGACTAAVSIDQGQSWYVLESLTPNFHLDLTQFVKGHYGWWLKLTLPRDGWLQSLRMTTTCQLSQAMYPRLKSNGSQIAYHTRSRSVVPIQPLFAQENATADFVEHSRSDNMQFMGRDASQRFAYRVLGPKPGWVVLKLDSPTALVGVSAAARYSLRVPTPTGADFTLDYSTDGGQSWQPLGRSTPPTDNEFSSGWVYGDAEFSETTPSQVLVRVQLYGGGYQTGLLHAELYGLRKTASPSAAEVTYRWLEEGRSRSHSFTVPAGQRECTATVPTGEAVQDHSVVISAK